MELRRIAVAMRPASPSPAAHPAGCCIHVQAPPRPADPRHGFSAAEVAMLAARGLTPAEAARRLKGDR